MKQIIKNRTIIIINIILNEWEFRLIWIIVDVNFEYFLNERPFLMCYRQGSGSHEIASILPAIVWQLHYIGPRKKGKNQGEWNESILMD